MDEWVSCRRLTAADGLVLAALTGLLFCVYLLTASLTFVSDDELFLFDATESIAKHHNVLLSETADLTWPGESNAEPVQPLLAAPIYFLANGFDGIGNVHATMLFNPLITALTGTLVFLYLRQLAFNRLTALVGAAAFGLSTIAWPYAKTFFREPLAGFTLFATAYCLLRCRDAFTQKQRTGTAWLVATILLALASIFAKESALFGAPMLLLVLWPKQTTVRRSRREWLLIALAVVVVALLTAIGSWLFDRYFNPGRFQILARLDEMARHAGLAQQGILGFLFSPGKSLFVYSPVLLLALAAPFAGGHRRLDTSWPLILLAAFVFMYSLVRGELWWGGTNWGPRYLAPLTPFLIVASAPLIEMILQSKAWLLKAGLAALFLLGVAVQAGAVSVKLSDYYDLLGSIRPDGAWTLGLWDPYYSAVLGHWRLLGAKPPEFAWMLAVPDGPAWAVPALTLGMAAVFAGAIWFGLSRELIQRRMMVGAVLVGFLATGVVTWFTLRAIYYDQRYHGNDEALHQLNAALRETTTTAPDPVIFLNNRAYFEFMLNYYKGSALWYTLALNPKELLALGELPPPPSTDPLTLVNDDALSVADYFARQHQTTFLIMEHGPFTPESPRPLEWWMSREFYYDGVLEFSSTVRLVEFSTAVAAPAPSRPSAHPVDYRMGDSIKLIGWDANPDGMTIRPGSVLNISTQWQAATAPGADFKIGTYLITPEGSVAAQNDSFPMNGFWPTITWKAEDVVRHNVALTVPQDLAPGFYEVWTLMYSPVDGLRLQVQDASGTTIRDHIVLFSVEVTR